MRTLLAFLLIASPAFADAESDSRVRVALALAAAASHHVSAEIPPDDGPPNLGSAYADALESSRRDRAPLVVFVNARARHFKDAHSLITTHFDGVKTSGIVIGQWQGKDFIRTDLPGAATDAEIWVVLLSDPGTRQTTPDAVSRAIAINKYLSQPLNHGSCPCGKTGQGCHCIPASACGREPCSLHNPLLLPPIQKPIAQLQNSVIPQNCPE